jgi:hypothetical protein
VVNRQARVGDEGLSDLGEIVRNTHDGFEAWNIPLDDAIAQIEHAYVTNSDDPRGWTAFAWMHLTDKGKELFHADGL